MNVTLNWHNYINLIQYVDDVNEVDAFLLIAIIYFFFLVCLYYSFMSHFLKSIKL